MFNEATRWQKVVAENHPSCTLVPELGVDCVHATTLSSLMRGTCRFLGQRMSFRFCADQRK